MLQAASGNGEWAPSSQLEAWPQRRQSATCSPVCSNAHAGGPGNGERLAAGWRRGQAAAVLSTACSGRPLYLFTYASVAFRRPPRGTGSGSRRRAGGVAQRQQRGQQPAATINFRVWNELQCVLCNHSLVFLILMQAALGNGEWALDSGLEAWPSGGSVANSLQRLSITAPTNSPTRKSLGGTRSGLLRQAMVSPGFRFWRKHSRGGVQPGFPWNWGFELNCKCYLGLTCITRAQLQLEGIVSTTGPKLQRSVCVGGGWRRGGRRQRQRLGEGAPRSNRSGGQFYQSSCFRHEQHPIMLRIAKRESAGSRSVVSRYEDGAGKVL